MDRFIDNQVAAGHFADASEVVMTALHHLVKAEKEYDAKMADLRAAIAHGMASGIAPDGSRGRVHQHIQEPAAKKEGQLQCPATI